MIQSNRKKIFFIFLQPFGDFKSIICERGIQMTKEEIIKKHFNTVYRLALSQTKNKAYADDVTQDVFLRFLNKERSFESDEHLKAWFIRVTINCSKSVFLSSWFKKCVPLSEELTFDTEEKSDVYYAVADLPPKYRTAIHLFYYEDLSISEIAKILDTKESTIKSHLHRGRELLKTKLKGGYDFV